MPSGYSPHTVNLHYSTGTFMQGTKAAHRRNRCQLAVRPAASPAIADWATHAVARHPFGTVGSILPSDDFAATVRVLYPFPALHGPALPWRAVAKSVGVAFAPDIDSDSLVNAMKDAAPDGAEPPSPTMGRIPGEIAGLIATAVTPADLAGQHYFVATWDGWAEMQGQILSLDPPRV